MNDTESKNKMAPPLKEKYGLELLLLDINQLDLAGAVGAILRLKEARCNI